MIKYEKYFGSPERVAATLKDIEQALNYVRKRDYMPELTAMELEEPIDWVIEEAGFGCPKKGTVHSLIEWLQEECDG